MAFTCGFSRHECAHAELFRANYQRTNRTKGSKILRCFPHCCPDHVTRSFCGAPLYLDVYSEHSPNNNSSNYSNASTRDEPLPLLLVFGRFRLQQETGFSVGELLSPDAIARSVQSDDNPNGEWIKSALIKRPARLLDATPWRFELNSSARWFYGWESGVAKSHRLREHVLDVLVTTPERDAQTTEWLRVVATAHSPPFKMISFRRATPEALTLLSASSAPTVPLPVHHSHKPSAVVRPLTGSMPPRPPRTVNAEPVAVPRPPVAASEPDPAAQLRDLVAVWTFVQRIPLRAVLSLTPTMARVFHRQLERGSDMMAASDRVDATLATLLRLSEPTRAPGPLLKIVTHVALWLCWDPVLHSQWRALVDDAVLVLLDGRALRKRFEWVVVDWLWSRLDAFLARVDWTLAALVAAVEIEIKPHADAAAWAYESFVAHVRERFVDRERQAAAVRRGLKRRRFSTPNASAVDGEWFATLDNVHTQTSPSTSPDAWRVAHLLWFWREFSAIAIALDPETSTLRVRSLARRGDDDGSDDDDMTLVLDHQCRWTRHLPSGASTLAVAMAGRSVGDYVGKVAPSQRELHANWYAWPSAECAAGLVASCFQVHVRAPATPQGRLVVRITENRGRVDARPLGAATAADVASEIRSRPLRQRLALVPQWEPSGEWVVEYARVA